MSALGIICLLLMVLLSPAAGGTPDEAVERFRQYLRIRTVQPDPDYISAVKFLQRQADSIGGLSSKVVEYVKGRPLLILTWKGTSPDLPSILLNSHMDVVKVDEDNWKHDPFEAFMEANGDIYARGAQDMKCVTMQYLEAIRNLKQAGFKPVRTIHLSIVPDEEIGGEAGFVTFADSEEFTSLNVGVSFDEGLASEGENYRVFNGERSPWWLTIKSTGSSGHGSRLYDNSALENLFKSLDTITSFRASQLDLWKAGLAAEGEVISVNPVYLRAGTLTPTGYVSNVQPSEAEAGFDIRVPPFADAASLERRIAEEWAPASRNMSFEYIQKISNLSVELAITVANESNPWWLLFKKAVKDAGGIIKEPEIFPAATDSRLIRALKIPAFGFSPIANTPILLHEDNEFLNAKVYLKGIPAYEEILKAFSSFTGSHEQIRTATQLLTWDGYPPT